MNDTLKRWLRFSAGLLMLILLMLVLAYAPLPGRVIAHNLETGIDASPLFYSEVENFAELEQGLVLPGATITDVLEARLESHMLDTKKPPK